VHTKMVYLLHFDRPISDRHSCQHYLGSADDLDARIAKHRTNPDARLLQVARERGIGFTVVRTWPGGREEERKLKRRKEGPKLCPICSAKRTNQPAPKASLEFTLDTLQEPPF